MTRVGPATFKRRRRRVRLVHASGRWSAPDKVRRRDLARLARRADILTTTEDRGRAGTIRPRGFRQAHAADTAVYWRRRRFDVVTRTRVTANGLGYDYYKPVGSPLVVLRDRRTGHRWIVGSLHMPIERTGARDYRDGRVLYPSILEAVSLKVDALAAKHTPASVILAGDWNDNLLSARVRARLERLTGLDVTGPPADYRGPGTGTTGHLTIDGVLTDRARRHSWRVLRRGRSSDHAPIRLVLTHRKEKP